MQQSTGKDKKNPSYLTKTDLIKYNYSQIFFY